VLDLRAAAKCCARGVEKARVHVDKRRVAHTKKVRVIGGGLAGSEAAMQLSRAGFEVELREQKPHKRTPAQVSDRLGELVCSNSFRSANPENAVGLIKEEMRALGSFIMACADEARVPAGDALAVDREQFAAHVEQGLRAAGVTIVAGEVTALPEDEVPTVVATGPLTSDALAADLARLCGKDRLAFYDAIAPIVEADSIHVDEKDPRGGYFLSRYGKGDGADYLNCPLDKEGYERFIGALLEADRVHKAEFEDLHYFEGCLPLEVMAERGIETLRFGPMKPVGLDHPATGRWPHAVLQLRKEDVHGTAYNLVGCQTRLKQPDQKAVLSLIPALADARFLRFGAIHRNTYVDAPVVLDDFNRLKARPSVFLAGQITGVEGYVESTASGLMVARTMIALSRGHTPAPPPETTALGGLWRHVRGTLRADPKAAYQPSNVTWAMVPPVVVTAPSGSKKKKAGKGERRQALVERARADLAAWQAAAP
jgi:methylenetetrahydrofolate--tRNA-(uracil-5-)-methyltransferase